MTVFHPITLLEAAKATRSAPHPHPHPHPPNQWVSLSAVRFYFGLVLGLSQARAIPHNLLPCP